MAACLSAHERYSIALASGVLLQPEEYGQGRLHVVLNKEKDLATPCLSLQTHNQVFYLFSVIRVEDKAHCEYPGEMGAPYKITGSLNNRSPM